jgi:LysR family transcriptional activator of nhaA
MAIKVRFLRTVEASIMNPRRLNYQHLLYFHTVVRTGSVTQACAELALSAPTVSAQLRTLEERFGAKLLARVGRTLRPTELGRHVYGYADQIFGLGRELLETLEQRPSERPLRLVAGIDDVLPKEIGHKMIEPALRMNRAVRLVCREGTLESLVARLAVHEIDVVISDAPVTPSLRIHAFNHSLGSCGVLWMAAPEVAKRLRRGFPGSLDGEAVLLPTNDTAIRRALDQWLESENVHPLMVGEFEDYAMLREFARAGHGFAPVPSVLEQQFRRELGFERVGVARGVKAEFYAISVERRIKNPAVAAITDGARRLFATDAR